MQLLKIEWCVGGNDTLLYVVGLRRGPRVFGLAEGEQPLNVGDRVLVAGQRRGYVRYSGQTKFAPGTVKRLLLPPASRRERRLCFHRHLSV